MESLTVELARSVCVAPYSATRTQTATDIMDAGRIAAPDYLGGSDSPVDAARKAARDWWHEHAHGCQFSSGVARSLFVVGFLDVVVAPYVEEVGRG